MKQLIIETIEEYLKAKETMIFYLATFYDYGPYITFQASKPSKHIIYGNPISVSGYDAFMLKLNSKLYREILQIERLERI